MRGHPSFAKEGRSLPFQPWSGVTRSAVVLTLLLATLTLSITAQQQQPLARIAYTLAMSRPASHLFEVTINLQTRQGQPQPFIDLQMPRWQPGRYAVANFAANVQEFSARSAGQPLPFEKIDDQTWRVQTRGSSSITVSYKVFGNDLSGTFAQLDATHGNYNGGEIFMYVVGHKQDPVELEIQPPVGWRVINGRTETPNQTSWRFPNYEILIDNPTEVGPDWTLDEFSTGGKAYRVVVHSRGPEDGLRPSLVRDVKKIVETQVAMWGAPDFDRYTFLYHFADDNRSFDGMEHLTSTQIMRPDSLSDPGSLQSAVESASHEFFHVWNVKRLRPVELGPWDWTRPASTRSLWIAEGLTEYYGKMMMRRAGLWDNARLLQEIAGSISDIENADGSKLMSAVDASLAAPFIDTAVHRQQTNLSNTSISYYTKGEIIGSVLDLTIRGRTNGKRSLDDVLKQMYEEFYLKAPNSSYYLRGRGYTEEDFVRVLSAVAGTDMRGFYDRHIRGVERLPFEAAFAVVGLRLVSNAAETFSSGIVLDNAGQGVRLGALRTDSAAVQAGLQQGDALSSIGGTPVTRQNWRSVLDRYKAGDSVRVQVQRFGREVQVNLVLREPARFSYRLEDLPQVTADARRLRSAWLEGN
jgi:predicted metalloprotease with PDZ domain